MAAVGKKAKKVHETNAVIVEKNEQVTYAQMVTNLKKQIGNKNDLKNEINGIRETKDGHLLLEIRKGSKETERVYQTIKDNMKEQNVKKYTGGRQKASANIYGLDIDANEAQIEDTLKETASCQRDEITIKALRPLTEGRQAATIIASEEIIKKLIQIKRVKIGFSMEDIRERNIIVRCNRCWEIGHIARECSKEDRSKKCRNCTKEDHRVKDCKHNPYCLNCEKEGHRTASQRCEKERAKEPKQA
ncbi:uncharacterized protein LOC123686561 [Harmonia axyridis]|uniref:uncharacterized protein LOC123686561 n=1 Tax=Harmonia axyridis TaxID=115357 RepID=UPI001E2783B7|nr:uncharacterized protein LOC123686561 [Harmonia axyridis]